MQAMALASGILVSSDRPSATYATLLVTRPPSSIMNFASSPRQLAQFFLYVTTMSQLREVTQSCKLGYFVQGNNQTLMGGFDMERPKQPFLWKQPSYTWAGESSLETPWWKHCCWREAQL